MRLPGSFCTCKEETRFSESMKRNNRGEKEMKTCPSCGREISSQSRFCTFCGCRLKQPGSPKPENQKISGSEPGKPKRSRKLLAGLGVTGLAILLAVGIIFAVSGGQEPRFQELMETGERYLLELDYASAEEYFLQAREIEPRKMEPYEKLLEIYIAGEEDAKQEKLLDEAGENLEPEDLKDLRSAAGKLEEQYFPFPEGEVVAELGELEYAPVDLPGYGWLIRSRGGYSFVSPDGTIRSASENGTGFYTSEGIYTDCILSDDASDQQIQMAFQGSPQKACGGPAGIGPKTVFVKDGDAITLKQDDGPFQKIEIPVSGAVFVSENQEPVLDASFNLKQFMANDPYYIYNPDSGKMHGPYQKEDHASFALQMLHSADEGNDWISLLKKQDVLGPFWTREEDLYSIWTEDGKQSLDGFDRVQIVSPQAIGVFKGRKFILYDHDLRKVYEGNADGGAMPVDGVVPLKKGNIWKLVRMKSLKYKEPEKRDSQDHPESGQEAAEPDAEIQPAIKEEPLEESAGRNEDDFLPNENQTVPDEPLAEQPVQEPVKTGMSSEEALEAARIYWNNPEQNGLFIREDAGSPETINGTVYYHFRLHARADAHITTVDEVWISSVTGAGTYDKPK